MQDDTKWNEAWTFFNVLGQNMSIENLNVLGQNMPIENLNSMLSEARQIFLKIRVI